LVLRGLSLAGNPNTPVNDMYPVEVKPLAADVTEKLAKDLLCSNINPPPENAAVLALHIAQNVEGFAYYVHHVAALLKRKTFPLWVLKLALSNPN